MCGGIMNKEAKFYIDIIPKFIIHLVKNYKNIWISFLDDEAERLRVEVYSLMNKRMNDKHGEYTPPEYVDVIDSKDWIPQKVKSEEEILKEIKERNDDKVEGLGEVVGKVIEEKVEDDGRREEEIRT
jgi:hypothetical protein